MRVSHRHSSSIPGRNTPAKSVRSESRKGRRRQKKKGASVWGVKAPFGACHGAGWWRTLCVQRQMSIAHSNAKIKGEMPAWSISPLLTPTDAQDGISDKSYIRRIRYARNSTLISRLHINRSQGGRCSGFSARTHGQGGAFSFLSYDIWKHFRGGRGDPVRTDRRGQNCWPSLPLPAKLSFCVGRKATNQRAGGSAQQFR